MTDPRTFAERLLAWWDHHGRMDLPWQHPRTPYRVWISEIMLQQTQVTTVIPYFDRWMKRFPDLNSLAVADADDVLACWSGLGYYARARNLHKTAVICREIHQGDLPDTAEALMALPGIGESTANAIISQAHDLPLPILDGNAKRVLARHAAITGWPGKSNVLSQLWAAAVERLPPARGADYTQAIMDLGAGLCARTKPACDQCPVNRDCMALAMGVVADLPTRKPKPAPKAVDLQLLVIRDDSGAIMLERRPPAGIWGGLWCLPEAGAPGFECAIEAGQAMAPLEHRLTHRLLNIKPHLINSDDLPQQVECSTGKRWSGPEDWPEMGLPKPIRTLLTNLQDLKTS